MGASALGRVPGCSAGNDQGYTVLYISHAPHSTTLTPLESVEALFLHPCPADQLLRPQATAQTKLPVDLPLPFCCCCCSCCVPGIANAASSSSSSSSSSSRLPPPASGLCGSRVDVDLAGGGGGAAPAPPEAADEACHAGEE